VAVLHPSCFSPAQQMRAEWSVESVESEPQHVTYQHGSAKKYGINQPLTNHEPTISQTLPKAFLQALSQKFSCGLPSGAVVNSKAKLKPLMFASSERRFSKLQSMGQSQLMGIEWDYI